MPSSSRPLRPLVAAACLLLLSGCEVPRFQGPQIQSPPPGFTRNPDTSQDQRLFPDRPVTHHDAWVRAQWGDFSGIYINAHAGPTSMEAVEEARRAALETRPRRPDQERDFSPVERLTIDGRDAMGWSELVRSDTRGIEYVAYRAVVPYDTVSYTVEFVSGDPAFKSRPDSLRAIVATFAVGRVEYNIPLILLVAGALLLVVNRIRARSRERKLRHASMALPTIKRPDEDGEGSDDGPAKRSAEAPKPGGPRRRTPPGPSDPS